MHCEQAETLLANHAFNELDAREKASLLEHLAKGAAPSALPVDADAQCHRAIMSHSPSGPAHVVDPSLGSWSP